MSAIDPFNHMWDGSEPGWKLVQVEHVTWKVVFRFSENGPSKSEVIELRELLDAFRNVPLSEVLRTLQGRSSYEVPAELDHFESHGLVDAARRVGLTATAESIDRSGHVFMSPDGAQRLIEDHDLAQQVAAKMIAAGVPIEYLAID